MLSKVVNAAVLVTLLTASGAGAQSLAQLGGPANLPPVGFSGQQFVDNRGCLFLRAGFGATVSWVPRVDRRHRPLCGFPPTFGAAVIAAVEADMVVEPQTVVVAAPVVVAVKHAVVAAVPQPQVAESAAVPRRGSLMAMLFGSPRPARLAEPVVIVMQPAPVQAAVVAIPVIPAPPRGYKLAWKDDRLNPFRGIGTATGQAQQDQVWTREVPAVLVTAAPQTPTVRSTVTVSTMSAPEAQGNAAYVQVGSFGEPANAAGAKARLKALGLPVSTSKINRNGKVLQVVYAGPFGSAAEARAALGVARGAGFGDAVLR